MSYLEQILENMLVDKQYDCISQILYHFPYHKVYNRTRDLENIRKILEPERHHIDGYLYFLTELSQLKEQNSQYEDVINKW